MKAEYMLYFMLMMLLVLHVDVAINKWTKYCEDEEEIEEYKSATRVAEADTQFVKEKLANAEVRIGELLEKVSGMLSDMEERKEDFIRKRTKLIDTIKSKDVRIELMYDNLDKAQVTLEKAQAKIDTLAMMSTKPFRQDCDDYIAETVNRFVDTFVDDNIRFANPSDPKCSIVYPSTSEHASNLNKLTDKIFYNVTPHYEDRLNLIFNNKEDFVNHIKLKVRVRYRDRCEIVKRMYEEHLEEMNRIEVETSRNVERGKSNKRNLLIDRLNELLNPKGIQFNEDDPPHIIDTKLKVFKDTFIVNYKSLIKYEDLIASGMSQADIDASSDASVRLLHNLKTLMSWSYPRAKNVHSEMRRANTDLRNFELSLEKGMIVNGIDIGGMTNG